MRIMHLAMILSLPWIPFAWPNEARAERPEGEGTANSVAETVAEETVVAPGQELHLKAMDGNATEAAWDGGPLLPVKTPLLAPDSGNHWLAVASRDLVGNPSAVRWTWVQVDDQPPSVVLSTAPPAIEVGDTSWIPPNAVAVAEAADQLAGLARLEIHFDGKVEGSDQGGSFKRSLPAVAGPVQPLARAIDRVGHTAEAALQLRVDATPPKGEFHVFGPHIPGDPHVLAPNSRIEAKIADGESGLAGWQPRIDGREADVVDLLAGPWSPGEHQVEALATDRVGNEKKIGPFHFVVDGSGPVIQWRLQGDFVVDELGRRIYRPPVVFEASAEDVPAGLASLELSLDDESFKPISVFDSPIVLHQEQVVLRATDRLGQTTTETATWRLDGEAPEFRLRVGGSDLAPGTLTIQIGEELRPIVYREAAGILQASYRFVRGFPLRQVESEARPLPKVFSFPSTGDWRLIIDATDQLGNTSSSQWDIVVTRGED